MKKIMFNDKYGLTQAVLEGRKTMTRRALRLPDGLKDDDLWNPVMGIDDKGLVYFTFDCSDGKHRDIYPQYQIGEVVAVAQSYEQVYLSFPKNERHNYSLKIAAYYRTGDLNSIPGWTNKMFVRADFMPHRIRIKNIKVERLQDISDEDCMKEGVWLDEELTALSKKNGYGEMWRFCEKGCYGDAHHAFAALIDRISGNGTWERNPWVFAYEFEKVD